VSAVVWYELLCGPVDGAQIAALRDLISEIVPFDDRQAELAASLFNMTGRRRQLRVDSMIAACAVSHDAALATGNVNDFRPFSEHGLQLLP
jgi:predicted nucleic acid-binding protein